MITLKTGIIGSGKSLSAVEELSKLLDKWATPQGEGARRPVLVHGIRGLSLEHSPLPVFPSCGSPGDPLKLDPMGRPEGTISIDWASVPDGALVIVDECQDAYPPRGNSTRVPDHVAWLQRSRHHDVDVVLITQHPRLIDATVRAFVGKHEHYRRMFGGARAVVYEWDSVSDGLSYKVATKRLWNYPRRAFKWYKSAEGHTKQAFRLPAWLMVPVLGIVLGAFAMPKAISSLHGAATGKGVSASSSASAPLASSSPAPSQVASLPSIQPPPASSPDADLPSSAPHVAEAASEAMPHVSGCIADAVRCRCFDVKQMLVDSPPQLCRDTITTAGKVLPLDSPFLAAAEDISPHSKPAQAVPMSEVRAEPSHGSAGWARSPGERQSQSWQAGILRDIERM